ncbi:MAG: hypothetical protein RXN91_10205 [Caldivirga sp.]
MAQGRRDELVERCRRGIPRECVGVQCWCADGVWRIYERLIEDWRRYDAMLWQLPFGTMSAVGVILTLAFHYIPGSEHVVRAALFIALAWFTLTMMHLSYKIRHFQIERATCAEAIEHLCTGFAVPYETGRAYRFVLRAEIERNPLGPLEREFYGARTYHLVYAMYIGLIAMLLYLAFIELLHVSLIHQILFHYLCGQQLFKHVHSYNGVAAIYACCTTTVLILIIIGIGRLQRWLQQRRRR